MLGSNDDGLAIGGDDTRLAHTPRIRKLNDRARTTLSFRSILVTAGINALGIAITSAVLAEVRCYDAFDLSNDPHGEHDFGAMTVAGERMFWKIDYYDETLEAGSPDPSDDTRTARVLTVMLASEY